MGGTCSCPEGQQRDVNNTERLRCATGMVYPPKSKADGEKMLKTGGCGSELVFCGTCFKVSVFGGN